MTVGRLTRWSRAIRFVGTPRRRGLVLLYHSIAELPTDPWQLGVQPARFAEHLEVITTHCRPMSLHALLRGLADGALPDRAVAVTFDDGYANNLHAAKPLLERFGVPATVFVVSGAVGTGREFWWDELERILLRPEPLPSTPAAVPGVQVEISLAAQAKGRQRLYREVWGQLQARPAVEQRAALDQLHHWARLAAGTRPTHRPLDGAELVALATGGLIEIGAHTVSHPRLAAQSPDRQRDEISDGKAALEAMLGQEVTVFAYPFGGENDFTPATVELVRAAGFSCGCANLHGVVEAGADRFALPRAYVRNWSGGEFARRVARWLRAA